MIVVFILFLFGLIGLLHLGFYIVIMLAVIVWLFSAVFLFTHRLTLLSISQNFMTFNAVLFFFLFFYLALLNRGRMACSFDELSHWADVVKAMTQLDVLSISSASNSSFQSYPPGISLFQYFEQELYLLFLPRSGFNDWLLYHSFQIFFIALILPFLKKINYRRAYGLPLAIACLLAPSFLFDSLLSTILVDPLISILSASAFAAIALNDNNDRLADLFVLFCASMLVLVKPAGLLFACFIGLFWILARLHTNKHLIVSFLPGLAAVFIPWFLWQLGIRLSNATIAFSNPVHLNDLFSALSGRDDGYRPGVRDTFFGALTCNIESSARFLEIELFYPFLIVLLFTLLLLAIKLQSHDDTNRRSLLKNLWIFQVLEFIVYTFGLLVMYLFKFGEYEAYHLASFQRYMAIPLESYWLITVFLVVDRIPIISADRTTAATLLLTGILSVTKPGTLLQMTNRSSVTRSQELRAPYIRMLESFSEISDSNNPGRVYYVSQQEIKEGIFFNIKYSFRPWIVSSPLGWNVSHEASAPDDWPQACTGEQLAELLFSQYDYLILNSVDETFQEECEFIFENGDIKPQSIYRINKSTGLLEWCSDYTLS